MGWLGPFIFKTVSNIRAPSLLYAYQGTSKNNFLWSWQSGRDIPREELQWLLCLFRCLSFAWLCILGFLQMYSCLPNLNDHKLIEGICKYRLSPMVSTSPQAISRRSSSMPRSRLMANSIIYNSACGQELTSSPWCYSLQENQHRLWLPREECARSAVGSARVPVVALAYALCDFTRTF